jgi:mannitol/fructose-specific phosphotransferase system IIA component
MFIRKNKNRSGSVSIQIAQKVNWKNKVIKIVGIAKTKREEDLLSFCGK